ncbi:MAG: hypothetical protein ACPKPY_05505 [Nitrososphaeraceae archaeon]
MGKPIFGSCLNCGKQTGQYMIIHRGKHSTSNPAKPYKEYKHKQYFLCKKCDDIRSVGIRDYLNIRNIK